MSKLNILFLFILLSPMVCSFGQIDEALSYDELIDLAIDYFQSENADSSIIVIKYADEKFPDNFGTSSSILAQIYTRTGNLTEAIDIWQDGLEKGMCYGLSSDSYQKYYKDNKEFDRLIEIEKGILDSSHLKYEIVKPSGFMENKAYPVLFVFHGNNRNISSSKASWQSPVLRSEFITVYLQSYIPTNPTDFKWIPADEKIKQEFKEIYDNVLQDYHIDESNIIFAGMSAGGRKALEFTMNRDFPVSGLVLNCPVIPTDISDEMVTAFVKGNKKLGIITGENDFALEDQRILVSTIKKQSGQSKIIVNDSLGHEFAENFEILLDEYLRWVIE